MEGEIVSNAEWLFDWVFPFPLSTCIVGLALPGLLRGGVFFFLLLAYLESASGLETSTCLLIF